MCGFVLYVSAVSLTVRECVVHVPVEVPVHCAICLRCEVLLQLCLRSATCICRCSVVEVVVAS